ncbi:hypothetical protein F4779DRAFT_609322 [Xylariaceae sp. FL0662B]|nr:hypothetical protein F4779DRAFT_609322 [Xylariaceae sp. FL0662B]
MPDQQLIKYTVEHYLKEGVSEEAFNKWFHEVHLHWALPLMKKHGVVHYAAQFRAAQLGTAFQAELDKFRPGWVVSKAHMVIEYWVPDLDVLKKLIVDPEWVDKAVRNQEDWIDMTTSTSHVGYETRYMENGQIIKAVAK